MNNKMILNFVLCLAFIISLVPTLAQASEPTRSTPPAWVEVQPMPTSDGVDPSTILGGTLYLIIDRQTNIPTQQMFTHFAYQVTNSDGVQNMSDIDVEYDPSYQTLDFHLVRLHRNGQVIDNLADHHIQVIQRESGMDRHLYDGSETAVINQENVQIGDIIEVAYSVTGFNPVHQGNFFTQEYFQYGLGIQKFHIRIMAGIEKPLHFHYFNGAPEPEVKSRGSVTEYVWDIPAKAAYPFEDYSPPWFDPLPGVWVSTLASWSDVVDWALPNYQVDQADVAALLALTNEISPGQTDEERILETIRFVQDGVRYLGMEQGLGAYKPNQPLGVYDRRFGDCKDKSLLLISLLRNLGVEAHPVLVNSILAGRVDPGGIAPIAFDHCIVKFTHDGNSRFVDPTLSNQGGDLETMASPPYGVGLVIHEETSQLESIPQPEPLSLDIFYNFTLEEIGGPALLVVRSTYSGSEADSRRDNLQSLPTDDLSRMNLDYYANAYPGISEVSPVVIEDMNQDGENSLIVVENYRIEDFWTQAEGDSSQFTAELYPLELTEVIGVPSSTNRATPYYLGPPLDIKVKIELKMPEDWPVQTQKIRINGEAFDYHSEIKGEGDLVVASYRYQRLTDHIAPEETPDFMADHDRIWDDLTFFLTYDPNLEAYTFSWFAASLVLATLLVGCLLAHRINVGYDPESKEGNQSPLPLGGWLVLIPIGMLIRIGSLFLGLVTIYLDHGTWTAIFSETGFASFSILGTLLTYEMLGHALLLVFSFLLLFQFFKKRTSFPRLMAWYMVSMTVFTLLDYLGVWFLVDDPAYHMEIPSQIGELVSHFFWTVVWASYLLNGQRPRNTFVVRRTPIPVVIDPGPPKLDDIG